MPGVAAIASRATFRGPGLNLHPPRRTREASDTRPPLVPSAHAGWLRPVRGESLRHQSGIKALDRRVA